MNEIPVEFATIADLSSIMDLYKQCTRYLLAQGIDQWDQTYPDIETAKQDIQKRDMYVMKIRDNVLGSIVINEEQDEQYEDIRWKIPCENPLVIHRLCINPNIQFRGSGKRLCLFAEEYGTMNGNDVIRLDTYTGNPTAMNLYRKLGYTQAGGHCFYHGCSQAFICMEKRLWR